MSSKRQLALAELQSRLAGILKTNGFQTDAGQRLVMGEAPVLGPDDPEEVLALVIRQDEIGSQLEKIVCRVPVEVWAIVKVSDQWVTVEAWQQVEAVISDIKTAVETDHDLDGTLLPDGLERGATQPIEREPGSEFAGASVGYRLLLAEEWGAP